MGKLFWEYFDEIIVVEGADLFTKVKDFEINGHILTSLSDDPRIELKTPDAKEYMCIHISSINRKDIDTDKAEIFWASDQDAFTYSHSLKFRLTEGENIIKLPSKNYDKLRIDFTSHAGVTINISAIELTNNDLLLRNKIDDFWSLYFSILLIFFLICLAAFMGWLLWVNRSYIVLHSPKVSLVICLLIIYCTVAFSLFSKIQRKEYESYTIYNYPFEEINTQAIDAVYSLQIYEDSIENYSLYFDKKNGFYGNGKITFFQNEKELFSVSAIGNGNKINFDVAELPLKKGEIYTVQVNLTDKQRFICYQDSENRLKDTQLYPYENKNILLAFVIIYLIAMSTILLIVSKTNCMKHIFIASSLIIGVIFCFVNPPYSVADEFRHFARAYSYAVNEWKIDQYKDDLPLFNLPQELADIRDIGQVNDYNIKRGDENQEVNMRVWLEQWNKRYSGMSTPVCIIATADISPIAYFPQIMLIKLSLLLGLSPISAIYMGRIGNLLVYSLAIGLSIRSTKDYRLILMAVGMIPLSLRFAASNSTDPLLISLTIILISLILHFIYKDEKKIFSLFNIFIFSLLAIGIASIKLPYLLLLFSLLAINKKHFKNSYIHKILFLVIVLGMGFLGYIVGSAVISSRSTGSSLNINQVIKNITSTPISSINTLLSGFYNSSSFVTNKYGIGYLDVVYIIYLTFAALYSSRNHRLTYIQKIIFLLIALLTWCTIIGVFWIVGKGVNISGMHGRYIFPILPFILLPFTCNNSPKLNTSLLKACSIFQMTILGLYLTSVFSNYYL